jgi:hypothetical protein
MKDSPKENVGNITSHFLAINEGLPEGEGIGRYHPFTWPSMKDSPKEKVGKISSLYLAINEGLPEGECREDIVPLPGHK